MSLRNLQAMFTPVNLLRQEKKRLRLSASI